MRESKQVRISQCMIVKNEEDNIVRALSWGKGIVSEQIVVDTGSTDRTVAMAREMGAKVYEFPWNDDFASAKNYAISKAGCEWIAFLDADEYFLPEDGKKLVDLVRQYEHTEIECILTALVDLDDEGKVISSGNQNRIFKNLPTIHYQRRIHEFLTTTDGHSILADNKVGELTIFHTGYGKKEKTKKKGRNLNLIQAELEEHPDDYEMWGYLGHEYTGLDEGALAEHAFRKAIALMGEDVKHYGASTGGVFYVLMEMLAKRPETEESAFMELFSEATKRWPKEPDFDYCAGLFFVSRNHWQKGEYHLQRSLQILEQYGTAFGGTVLTSDIKRVYELLAVCCYNNKNLSGCVRFTTASLKEDPYLMGTIVMLLRAFSMDEQIRNSGKEGAVEVLKFLGSHFYDLTTLKDRLFILRAAMAAEYGELIEGIRGMFTPEELQSIDRALGRS